VDTEVTRRAFECVDKEKIRRIMEDGTMTLKDEVPLFSILHGLELHVFARPAVIKSFVQRHKHTGRKALGIVKKKDKLI
jgi:hypothetical protein